MSNDWNDYPFSAFSAALGSAFGLGLGFLLALAAGVAIGFFGCGANPDDLHDGFFFLYLFFLFPVHLLAGLGRPAGFVAVLASLALLILYFKWDGFKLELLVLYALSVALCTFLGIGSSPAGAAEASWLKFALGCGALAGAYLAVRAAEFVWWKTRK